jgi:hypothetical protein
MRSSRLRSNALIRRRRRRAAGALVEHAADVQFLENDDFPRR